MLLLAKKLCGTVCKLRAGSPVSSATDVISSRDVSASLWGKSHAQSTGRNLV